MSDHTPAQLARILAPLWEAVPEARPKDQSGRVLALADYGVWAFCTTAMHADCVVVVDEVVARDLILARLQLAIEKRVNANGGYLDMYSAGNLGLNITACLFVPDENSMAFSSIHPDPIIARAQLLAKIVGVELGDADA